MTTNVPRTCRTHLSDAGPRIDLYWLPLGAGGHVVRWNGRVFEALSARRDHRAPADLYHCALEAQLDGTRIVVELGPAWGGPPGAEVVAYGPVGWRPLGGWRLFRYEVRRWRDGVLPDRSYAVGGPHLVPTDAVRVRRLLDLVPEFPAYTWGRDELCTGDMWNSNSLVSWVLSRSGHDTSALAPPANGRAPGWVAGLVVARRQADRCALHVSGNEAP